MTTIVVNTAADTVANDGKTSLREAIAQAANTAGHVDIRFDEAAFTSGNQVVAISLTSTLTISKGDITIDGSLFYAGPNGNVTLSAAGLSANAVTVEAAARVVLRDLVIEGTTQTTQQAAYGAEGTPGVDGVNGANGYAPGHEVIYGDGTPGTSGTDGQAAPNDAGDGNIAVGAIINRGTLTLERVAIESFRVKGGAGGVAGEGGQGGNGGNGERGSDAGDPSHPAGGSGGNAGNGADGAIGGAGGDAAAGIYNVGTLTLRDTSFGALSATGGNGGRGGDGGWGGAGGNFGKAEWPDFSAHGGDGGNGGDGGRGGNGGSAAAAVFNGGTLTIDGVQSGVSGRALVGGVGSSGGLEGSGGTKGRLYPTASDTPGQDGISGVDGAPGARGADGATGDFLGANVKTGASFIVDAQKVVISDTEANDRDRTVNFSFSLFGAPETGTKSVKWSLVAGDGINAADFKDGIMPLAGGTLDFPGSTTGKFFGFVIAKDSKAEGIESFTIKLSDPVGGKLGWSKSVTVYIVDGDTEGHAPTAIKLDDTSIAEDANTNTRLGKLSTTDSDEGDQFSYSLINSAGGRFKLVGNQVKVANGVLLDYEQARSHKIVVRATDLFGNTFDKSFTVKVTDVARENVVGDAGANKIVGGAKNDSLDGGGGNDTLTGGRDDDKFVFSTALNAASNLDHVTDFASGQDRILLDHHVFAGLAKGSLPSDAFHAGAGAADREDRIIYRSDGTLLFDKDGNKPGGVAPIAFAILDHHPALKAGDFLVI